MLPKCILQCLALTGAMSLAAVDVEAAPAPIGSYVVRETGVGPFDATVAFDVETLEKLLPAGSTVAPETVRIEGAADYTVLRVWKDKELLMELESNGDRKAPRVTGVTVFTPRIADEKGARIKARMKSLYRYGDRPDCIPGAGRYTGRIFCTATKSAHIIYVFGGEKPAKAGEMPPPAEYAKWRLKAIMWSAR